MASETAHLLFLFTLFFFFFFFFFFSSSFIHAKLDLHPSDFKALRAIQRDMGLVNGQPTHPCNSVQVFCERRLCNNHTYHLRITRLVLNSMHLNGTLSPSVGRLTGLRELSLPNNNLVDRIPHSIVHLTKLEVLDLRNNLFSGEVPSQLSSLTRLRVLDVSSNALSGNLNFLKSFPDLEILDIADNLFVVVGRVPAFIRCCRNLRYFNFSGNRFLEGSTPLAKRPDQSESVDASAVRKRFIFAESTKGLNLSSSAPAPRSNKRSSSGAASAPAPAPSQVHRRSKRKLFGFMLGLVVTLVVGGFAMTIHSIGLSSLFERALAFVNGGCKGCAATMVQRYLTIGQIFGSNSYPHSLAIYSPSIIRAEDLVFLEKDDGLANFEIIGRGGCGEVYKAELPGSKVKMIAIKKILQPFKDASELVQEDSKLLHKKMRQIRSEINTVGKIRHRNLVPLLAHVPRLECQYLVYEYMKNGSLQNLLDEVRAGERELDWLTRHKIALGVAFGLEYLHMSHSPRIIHRDLKPANILLDDHMEARITDFGLAKAMSDAQTHILTSKVSGTAGYIAPEYHRTLKFSEKSDIYSFGVVLGVLVMGKFPYDEFFQHTFEMTLVKWMRKVMTSENPKKAIDARLLGNGYEEQMLLVLRIACFCTMDGPKNRPNSKDVRCMLSRIKHSPVNM